MPTTNYTDALGKKQAALGVQVLGSDGEPASDSSPVPVATPQAAYSLPSQPLTSLAAGASVTLATGMKGGGYVFNAVFSGAAPYSLQLLCLGEDQATPFVVATLAAPGSVNIVLGNLATLILKNNGANPITGLWAGAR